METYTFKVKKGLSLRHNIDLTLTPDRVRLGDCELPAAEVEWIRHHGYTSNYSGIKTGTNRGMALGNSTTTLQFGLADMLYSTKRTKVFPEILSLVLRFYGSRIVEGMIDTLASGGNFSVGKLRFTPTGVEFPKKKHLVLSDKPVAVPWARIICGGNDYRLEQEVRQARGNMRQGLAQIITGHAGGAGVVKCDGVFLADSATSHQPKVLSHLLGIDSFYSTSHEENSWTPNACLVEPVVRFMQEHPEISGGPWFATPNNQKLGPFYWSQLRQMAAGGLLQRSDMVMQDGTDRWLAAISVPGLFPGT